MKSRLNPISSSRPAFALISVLALVSLAALTATAFLASARLERSATRTIGDITRLQMTLNTGKECATEIINRIGETNWNFVTTYWRTNPADDIGYLFLGKRGGTTLNPLAWPYTCGFTPAKWTNLDSNSVVSNVTATNLICQASFSNDISAFMSNATSGFSVNPSPTSRICTLIPLLGGRTSPPVGWVYIKQDIRTNPSSTNTANLPVARFAYFIEDLGGLIDAERMGGTNSRPTGTNAEEISLTNLTGFTAPILSIYTNKRPQYLTPGMLLSSNGGFLNNTNDLRYFASRLRYCNWSNMNQNWSRISQIPISVNAPFYPTSAGSRKIALNTNLNLGGQSIIAATITNSFPMFANRAGGMNSNLYVNALAANIVDYADADSSPTTVNVGTPTAPTNAVGYDSYPLLTHLYDEFTYSSAARTITHRTWMQFWNPSTQPTVATAVTVNFTNNDIVRYTNTTITNTNRLYPFPGQTATTFNLPVILPNAGYVTNFTRPNISLSGFPSFPTAFVTPQVWLNCQTGSVASLPCSNSFSYTIGGSTITPAMTLKRQIDTLNNSTPNFSAGFLAGNQYISAGALNGTPLPIHDPRMTPYLGQGSANQYAQSAYNTTYWGGYVSQTGLAANMGLADPAFWPDAAQANVASHGTVGGAVAPTLGAFANPESAPCKISNSGYSNICELGNIFDPIQWRSLLSIAETNFSNTNIISTWTANSLYGGGSTLRIGRPEHSRFAFTNLGGTYPVPSLGTSAAGLLELFCVTNDYNWAGKININTAPLPVLAALAGGITINTANYNGTAPVNGDMIRAFTNGVAKFRRTYPFITPSQLAFISSDYGDSTTFTNSWPTNAVFSTNASGGLSGPTAINDQGREEWFSKIYNLTCVQSFNYRIYVIAQLTYTNGDPRGAMMRKYYQIYLNNNSPQPAGGAPDTQSPSVSPLPTYEAFY